MSKIIRNSENPEILCVLLFVSWNNVSEECLNFSRKSAQFEVEQVIIVQFVVV